MKKLYFLFILLSQFITAQVGINTTDPKAQLEIKSSNQLTPSNTDGLLIPKIDAFPTANPTIAQQGMLVYLNTLIGTNQPGFYYWDNPTTTWLPIKGNNGVTLDQAYDFGGAGNGKTITADAGAVLIDGTDGLVSTGTFNSGATAPTGAGTRMVWNPRKAAFRSGMVPGAAWNDVNIGLFSVGIGENTLASGRSSVALGSQTEATGEASVALGSSTQASGFISTAFGNATSAVGNFSTSFGQGTAALGSYSTVFGNNIKAKSYGEMALGLGATDYTVSTNGATQFGLANATDRLFVIGNAIDVNNNNFSDPGELSDALIILKNGLTRLPSTTNAMITAADGKAVVTKEFLQTNTSGTLDQAYDFGGAGLGKTITADSGAVLIDGTDGLVSTGTLNSGAIAPSGIGTRMVWNPRKAAFRAGSVTGVQWDDANVGSGSVAFSNATASGTNSFAVGNNSSATGFNSVAFGTNVLASGGFSMACGSSAIASGQQSFVFGTNATASGLQSTSFGGGTLASGFQSTAFGALTSAIGTRSAAFGDFNTASSYGETVLGIGSTNYTPSANGDLQFRTANANDRLLTIGNAIDVNNNGTVDVAERSDALVVLKNGATGIGTSLPNALLDVNATDNGILIPRIGLTSVLAQAPVVNPRGGVLPVSTMIYNTATAGVSPNNVYPGFYYWNGIKWIRFDVDGENNPRYYTVVGTTADISTTAFTLLEQMSITFTPKDDVVIVNFSAAGHRGDDSCQNNAIFFQILLNGIPVSGWQTSSYQAYVDSSGFSSDDITSWDTNISYPVTVPIGISQTVQIQWYAPNCTMFNNPAGVVVLDSSTFKSYRTLTIIDPNGGGGIVGVPPVTTNVWAHNGNAGTNSATNFVGTADFQPLVLKSNNIEGLRIGTTGNVGMGTTFPLDKLHVAGSIRMVDGNQAVGKIMTSDINGTASWQDVPNNSWSLTGNSGTSSATNFMGTTDNQSLAFRTNNTERVAILNTGNVGIGSPTPTRRLQVSDNSTSTINGQLYLEQAGTGDALMHIGNAGGRHFNIGLDTSADSFKIGTSATAATAVTTGTLMTLLPTGEVGIGTATPQQNLHVSGPAGVTTVRIANTSATGTTSNVALDFFRATAVNTDWRIYNTGANLNIGNSGDDLATVNDLYQFQGIRFMPMNDATQSLGQLANRWNTVFASNGVINTSDARQKKNIQNLNYGLTDLMKLRPVSFEWKKDDGSGTKLGLIAQELQQVIPEVVRDWDWKEDSQGNRTKVEVPVLGVYYSDLIPVLIKSIQEQQAIIDKQNSEIQQLNQKMELIITEIEKLKK